MLKVLPVRDKEKQKEYCALLSLEYDPDLMCFAACETAKVPKILRFVLW